MTDAELLAAFKKNPNTGMELIFKAYFADMVKVVYRMIFDQGKAEDIVQDVFMKFWNNRHQLQIDTALKPYLKRSCTNACIDYLRKNKNRKLVPTESTLLKLSSSEHSSLKVLESRDLQKAIQSTIDGLSPKCKAVFLLSRKEQMSNQEIADHLQVTLKTVEAHITVALKKLRITVKNYNNLG